MAFAAFAFMPNGSGSIRGDPVMNIVSYCVAASVLVIATTATAQSLASNPVPRGNLSNWLDVEAAPPELMKQLNNRLTVRFTLSVGPDGRPTGCTHDGRTNRDKQFGELTCSQMKRRARFHPAKDAQGLPVNGTYSNTATWYVPKKAGVR